MMNKLPFELEQPNIVVKRKAVTSKDYGDDPNNRDVNYLLKHGVINLDKYKGPTSHQVTDYAKKVLNLKKAGHSGTLDPGVTGVLPIALENSTRVVQVLLKAGKEYICIMHLHRVVDESKLLSTIKEFVGEISQKPPIKSAVKRKIRQRRIYYLQVLEIDNKDLLFLVGCEAGTYIRKLVHDIGEKLGVGAHMAELRRTKAGPYNEDTLITLQELADAVYYYKMGNDKLLKQALQPLESAIAHLPKIWVLDSAVDSLCHGASLSLPGISKYTDNIDNGKQVAVLTLKGELICLGLSQLDLEGFEKEKGLAVKDMKVFMCRNTYPKVKS
jgi:H/ACA ribonucleoprotein complex subunit 4